MASVSKNKQTGDVAIQFMRLDGKRKTLRLGKPRQRTVDTFKSHLEELLEARAFGRAAYDETIAWSNRLFEKAPLLYGKLANHGLVPNRAAPKQMALAMFLDDYIAKQQDKKRSTIICLTQCRNDLVEFFGADRSLAEITEGDAEDWRQFLRSRTARPGPAAKNRQPAGKVKRRCGTGTSPKSFRSTCKRIRSAGGAVGRGNCPRRPCDIRSSLVILSRS